MFLFIAYEARCRVTESTNKITKKKKKKEKKRKEKKDKEAEHETRIETRTAAVNIFRSV